MTACAIAHLRSVEFDPDIARGWYESAADHRILPLRTNHAGGLVILADGVTPAHRATDILAAGRRPVAPTSP